MEKHMEEQSQLIRELAIEKDKAISDTEQLNEHIHKLQENHEHSQ
jgi:hypothetical protein